MATKKNKEDRFEQIGSKIDPAMAEVLDACCNALGVDIYHLLQWFCYVIVKASAPMHALDPRIQKLMTMLDRDAGWQNAFNLCNPDKLKVAQVILILEQEGHRGFGAVMVDKPWMGEMTNQTECVDDILERVAEVTMSGIYRRLRLMGAELDCNNLSDILLTMLDAQDIANLDASDRAEGPQMGDIAPNGKAVAYGKRTKRKKHFSPDTMPVTGNLFDDIDHDAPAPKLEDWEGEKLGTDSTD
jgi:hypothetical protein